MDSAHSIHCAYFLNRLNKNNYLFSMNFMLFYGSILIHLIKCNNLRSYRRKRKNALHGERDDIVCKEKRGRRGNSGTHVN